VIRGRYGLLIGLAVAAMLSVAAGAGLFMAYAPLPDPSAATTEQIFRWLVTRDLSRESPAIQVAIVRRLDVDFEQTSGLAQEIAQLSDPHRAMLWNNISTLLVPWLLEKADAYAQLPAAQRIAYLDSFLDRVDQWSKIGDACRAGGAGQSADPNLSMTKLFADRIAESSAHAEPAQRKRIAEFLAALQSRWVWRKIARIPFLGGKSSKP